MCLILYLDSSVDHNYFFVQYSLQIYSKQKIQCLVLTYEEWQGGVGVVLLLSQQLLAQQILDHLIASPWTREYFLPQALKSVHLEAIAVGINPFIVSLDIEACLKGPHLSPLFIAYLTIGCSLALLSFSPLAIHLLLMRCQK